MSKNALIPLFCALLLVVPSISVFATKIIIVDSDNKPIQNVVIGFNNDTHSQAKASAEIAIMDQVAYQFLPKILVVSKDQWVDFPNSDDVRHHVYSFSSPKPFEIKMFTGSEAKPIQFSQAGIVVLGCNIHDSMVGFIYVSDHALTKSSNSEGVIDLLPQDLSALKFDRGDNSIVKATLWHPLLSPIKTKRIDIQIDTSLVKQIIPLDIKQSPSDLMTKSNGFSSKFNKR